jgi:hypothetical protein
MKKPFNLLLPLFVIGTSCRSVNSPDCKVKELKTLFTTPGVYQGKVTGYAHYVLIKDFDRSCMDSVTMTNMALKYSDTVHVGKPADVIMFFNSDKNFIPHEISQAMEEINKNCLVVVGLDLKNKKPEDFIFYNSKGERVYWGPRWLPQGK